MTPDRRTALNSIRLTELGKPVGLVSCAALAASLLVALPEAAGRPTLSPNQSSAIQLAQKLLRRADAELFIQMQALADWLEDYYLDHGRLPNPAAGIESDRAALSRLALRNPYRLGNGTSSTSGEDHCHLRFIVDGYISPYVVPQIEKSPPETWRATPGTLTIISNQEDCFLIWGAGSDGKPLKDVDGIKSKMIFRKFQAKD